MRLNRMIIDRFKGISHFEVDFGGRSADIYGDNATGKTTIADAVLWLLFDKDTDGRKAFSIQPLDDSGRVAEPGAETRVEGVFSQDGRVRTLAKTYREVWARKRGSAQAELTGHKTDYTVDGVPTGAREYAQLVDSLVPTHLVPILTNPLYFASELDWKARRKMLLEVAGDVTDADVLAQNDAFAALMDETNGDDVETLLLRLRADRRAANDELGKIPARMDELSRMLEEEPQDMETISLRMDALQRRISALQQPDGNADDTALRAAMLAETKALRDKMAYQQQEDTRRRELAEEARRQTAPLRETLQQTQDELYQRQQDAYCAQMEQAHIEERLAALRERFSQIAESDWNGNTVCPTCGQDLPEDAIAESQARYRAQRDTELDSINDEGAALRQKQEDAKSRFDDAQTKIVRLKKKMLDVQNALDAQDDGMPPHAADYEEKLHALQEAYENAHAEVERLQNLQNATRKEVTQAISQAREELETLQKQVQIPQRNAQVHARIQQLQQRQRELAGILARADVLCDAAERFNREKCAMLQARMDALFHRVRWRLWREQINGGMADCCDALIDGVPFADANNAAKINAGMEIIAVLSGHYEKTMPIIVDSAESVTQLQNGNDLQVIRLIVSEQDKTLRVEVKRS